MHCVIVVKLSLGDLALVDFDENLVMIHAIKLHTGGGSSAGDTAGLQQHLAVARVGLVLDTIGFQANDSIKYPYFAITALSFSKAPFDLEVENFCKFGLVPIEAFLRGEGREVITVDDQ